MKRIASLLLLLICTSNSINAQEVPERENDNSSLDEAENFFADNLFTTTFVRQFSKVNIIEKNTSKRTLLLKKQLYSDETIYFEKFKITNPLFIKKTSTAIYNLYPHKKNSNFVTNFENILSVSRAEFNNYIFEKPFFANDSLIIKTGLNEDVMIDKYWISKAKLDENGLISGVVCYKVTGPHNDTSIINKTNYFYEKEVLIKKETIFKDEDSGEPTEIRTYFYDDKHRPLSNILTTFNKIKGEKKAIENETKYTYQNMQLIEIQSLINKKVWFSWVIKYDGDKVDVLSITYNNRNNTSETENKYSYKLIK